MSFYHPIKIIFSRPRLLAITCLFLCGVRVLYAQSTIIGLRFNNQSVEKAKLTIILPGNDGNKSEAKKGDLVVSGSKLIIPANTIVMLQSPGGKQKLSSTTGQPLEYTLEITGKGENHVIQGLGAQIQNSVTKTLGYNYKVNNGKGTTAASKGTEFTFTDLSDDKNEKASIVTSEGTINIIDQVPCTINGEPVKNERKGEAATQSVSHTQTAGDSEFTSSDDPIDYPSLDAAVKKIEDEINSGEIDSVDIADNLNCLGILFMDAERFEDAVKAFSQAYEIYENEYIPDDMITLEAKLYLAEALVATKDSVNQFHGRTMANDMLALLWENLNFDKEDFRFTQTKDKKAQEGICRDIAFDYQLLGWAYGIAGDTPRSDKYYRLMMINYCNQH